MNRTLLEVRRFVAFQGKIVKNNRQWKKIVPFSKNAGHLSHFAGHLMKMWDCPVERGTVDTYAFTLSSAHL